MIILTMGCASGKEYGDQPNVSPLTQPTAKDNQPLVFRYRVEAPEKILGPGNQTDTHFNTLQTQEGLFGYQGNSTTWTFFGSSLETLRQLPKSALGPGAQGMFDECGAWLNATAREDSRIIGWYHAENECNYPATHKSIAYAESYDGGRTFVKVGYPNNRVLTADKTFDDNPDRNDVGDHAVLRVGDYYYMYYLATSDWRVHLARAPVGKGGPGTWTKYFQGAFSEPGIGGRSTPIEGLLESRWVTRDSITGKFIGLTRDFPLEDIPGDIRLSFSDDGLAFTPMRHPLIPTDESYWERTPGSTELLDYFSILGLDGDSHKVGSSFWIYHMYLLPGEGFDRRYMLRRLVTREIADPSDPIGDVPMIALVRYRNDAINDDWVTTVQVDDTYKNLGVLGYLLTANVPGTLELFDCFIEPWNDHMVSVNRQCEDEGEAYVRRLGFVLTESGSGRVPVYRCFDNASTNHFLSTDPMCEEAQTEGLIGFLLKP